MRHVLVLSDGVAGHDRASEGVLAALRLLGPVEPRWLAICERRPRSRRLARVAAALYDPAAFLSRNVALTPDRLASRFRSAGIADWPATADIVLATGPSTAAAAIAAGRRHGARTIYVGFPKTPALGLTLILSPVPSRVAAVATVPRPTVIDAPTLAPPRPLDVAAERHIAVLFGGDTKHHAYTADEMMTLGTAIARLLDAAPLWQVSVWDSRRTRDDTFDALVPVLRAHGARVAVYRFAAAGLASNAAAFESDAIIVSADSLSMIGEAVAAARPTLVVAPAAYGGPRRDRAELAELAEAGRIARARFAFAPSDVARLTAPPPTSQPRNLAALLAARGF